MTEALIGFAAMLLLIFLRVPVAFSMALVGFIVVDIMRNWPSAYSMTGAVVRERGFQYLLFVLPLFILMGNFITQAMLYIVQFAAAYAFMYHRIGGLAVS